MASYGRACGWVDVHVDVARRARLVRPGVTSSRAPLGLSVGITNTRLSAEKRGIAVELALRLAATANTQVCLVGADPTDRDVQRRLPQLVARSGRYTRTVVREGAHALEVAFLPDQRLCVVALSDRAGVESVLPELQGIFEYVIVDAPSRVGSGGVGISRALVPLLDALVVASGLSAGELALTRGYIHALEAMAGARHVDVRVVGSGETDDGGLALDQLERRLRALPMISRIPQLWGRAPHGSTVDHDDLDAAFRPIVDWIVETRRARTGADSSDITPAASASINRHLATLLYRRDSGV